MGSLKIAVPESVHATTERELAPQGAVKQHHAGEVRAQLLKTLKHTIKITTRPSTTGTPYFWIIV